MPPVLSKGGAASKLSATEPASVWAPSPETNCQQTEIKVSQWDETNTQEGRRTLKDTEQVGSTPTSEHYCGYATPKSRGWVVHPILMSLPKSLSAFRNCNASFNARQNCLLLLKDQRIQRVVKERACAKTCVLFCYQCVGKTGIQWTMTVFSGEIIWLKHFNIRLLGCLHFHYLFSLLPCCALWAHSSEH